MRHLSVFDLFCIGIGPSSSHTVGPMRAARSFLQQVRNSPRLDQIVRIRCDCYGSLALTGRGHLTDTAIMLGLMDEDAETVDTTLIPNHIAKLREENLLHLTSERSITFIPGRDIDLSHYTPLDLHPNGMQFTALDANENVVEEAVIYSTGGGIIASDQDLRNPAHSEESPFPYPYASMQELLRLTDKHQCSIADIVMANECSLRSEKEVKDKFKRIWECMRESISHGVKSKGTLPGGLNVPRRARKLRRMLLLKSEELLKDPLSIIDWVNLYAIAVAEENAAGGRVVTAPTNGAAGIIPAVLNYAVKFCTSPHENAIERFLLTAGGIAILYKKNASISGADVGCQGEVGVACSMAAAGLTDYLGGNPSQIENAAEIGIEHNLGLTCDPVSGLVQIPCIERNAMAAIKALNACRIAIRNNSGHIITLDQAIRTMLETGRDMNPHYKETSIGGLASNSVNC